MPAYIVFIRESTRDPAELERYTPKAGASLAGHPIKILVAYGRQEVLEGLGVAVVANFDSSLFAHYSLLVFSVFSAPSARKIFKVAENSS